MSNQFSEISDVKIKLSEHFLSIQGEGPSIGKLAYFIRFAGCSVRCKFCDSQYSWADESKVLLVSLHDVISAVRRAQNRVHMIVITGGEPLEQPRQFYLLGHELWRYLYKPIEVETSLSSQLSMYDTDNSLFRWIVSPKDKNIQDVEKDTNKELMSYLVKTFPTKTFLKPVIENDESLSFWMSWAKDVGIKNERIYLMPEAANIDDLHKKSLWLAEKAVELGVNFSYRLHIELWKGQRGK